MILQKMNVMDQRRLGFYLVILEIHFLIIIAILALKVLLLISVVIVGNPTAIHYLQIHHTQYFGIYLRKIVLIQGMVIILQERVMEIHILDIIVKVVQMEKLLMSVVFANLEKIALIGIWHVKIVQALQMEQLL